LRAVAYTAFSELPSAYHALLSMSAERSFYLGQRWHETLLASANDENAVLRLYGVEEGETGRALALLVAATPAFKRASILRYRARVRPSLSALTGFQTTLFDILLAPDADPQAIDRLIDGLAQDRPRWAMLDFAALDPGSPSFAPLVAGLRKRGYRVEVYRNFVNRFERLGGKSFADYFADRPKNGRLRVKDAARRERLLDESGRADFSLLTHPDEVDVGIDAYERVYRSSWKQADYHPNFVPALLRAAAHEGVLRLFVLRIDEVPVATVVIILSGRRATIYANDFDGAFSKLGVGAICILKAIRHMIDTDRIEEFDYGRGDEPYKKIWASECRDRMGVLALDPRTIGGWLGMADALRAVGQQRTASALRPLRTRVRAVTTLLRKSR
jgi:CelD/BcsL family acetyltransferase involved in cellulose biosynthesis